MLEIGRLEGAVAQEAFRGGRELAIPNRVCKQYWATPIHGLRIAVFNPLENPRPAAQVAKPSHRLLDCERGATLVRHEPAVVVAEA